MSTERVFEIITITVLCAIGALAAIGGIMALFAEMGWWVVVYIPVGFIVVSTIMKGSSSH